MEGLEVDTMKVIYKILERLDEALDEEKPDFTDVGHEALGISKIRWNNVIIIMQNEGLISGANINNHGGIEVHKISVFIKNAKITLKGLQWLSENSNIAKILRAAKEIKDFIPEI